MSEPRGVNIIVINYNNGRFPGYCDQVANLVPRLPRRSPRT
jgi:hypothetical protein